MAKNNYRNTTPISNGFAIEVTESVAKTELEKFSKDQAEAAVKGIEEEVKNFGSAPAGRKPVTLVEEEGDKVPRARADISTRVFGVDRQYSEPQRENVSNKVIKKVTEVLGKEGAEALKADVIDNRVMKNVLGQTHEVHVNNSAILAAKDLLIDGKKETIAVVDYNINKKSVEAEKVITLPYLVEIVLQKNPEAKKHLGIDNRDVATLSGKLVEVFNDRFQKILEAVKKDESLKDTPAETVKEAVAATMMRRFLVEGHEKSRKGKDGKTVKGYIEKMANSIKEKNDGKVSIDAAAGILFGNVSASPYTLEDPIFNFVVKRGGLTDFDKKMVDFHSNHKLESGLGSVPTRVQEFVSNMTDGAKKDEAQKIVYALKLHKQVSLAERQTIEALKKAVPDVAKIYQGDRALKEVGYAISYEAVRHYGYLGRVKGVEQSGIFKDPSKKQIIESSGNAAFLKNPQVGYLSSGEVTRNDKTSKVNPNTAAGNKAIAEHPKTKEAFLVGYAARAYANDKTSAIEKAVKEKIKTSRSQELTA